MRAPVSWLREYVEGAPVGTGREVAASLARVGLEEEALHGGDITGPLVVGRVLELVEEPQKNGKTIRWCQVDVGRHGQRVTEGTPQGVVCGALNFAVGDLVVVVIPGAVLPGGISIGARKTYGHVSNGMICSARELGLGEEADGIIVLQSLLGEEAAARLTPGDDAIELLGLGDEVVEVTVTPDRGYCLSMRGIAREYTHATGGTLRDPAAITSAAANTSGYAVQLADEAPLNGREGCDRYVARVVRGVNASATSPPWMQKRLTQMGMRPISLAVDVTNYVMLALGQPLHAFDVSTLQGPIVVRRARAGETLKTLDDVERTLYPEDLLITDGGTTALAIAGVMGGATSEVGASTTDVLVEAAHFDPTSVARSSRRHRLTTEASKRFERGVDPDITAVAAQLAVNLLVELGGGAADDGVTDVDHRPARARIELDPSLPTRLVGLRYSREQVIATLREIGCDVLESSEPESETGPEAGSGVSRLLSVLPPSWRPDLRNGPDFVEEIARLRGYDQIPSVIPQASSGRGLTHGQRVRRVLANTLAGQGFVEVLTYPFVSAKSHDDLGLEADDPRRVALRIANPLSEEAPLMRTSVLSTMVEALRRNVSRGQRDVAVFELGLVTLPDAGRRTAPVPGTQARPDDATLGQIMAAVPPQPRRVAFALAGDADPSGWWGPGRSADWTDVVGAARAVASALAVELVVRTDDLAPWHPGRCARLELTDGTLVGHAGELHPKVVTALGLPPRTCAAELDVDVLTTASDVRVQVRELSTYPVAQSDVALVVDEQVAAAALESALRQGAGEMLESVSLLDIYRGDQVGPGRKSLAYRLVFRAPDRTLTTKEVNGLRDRAIAAAAAAVGAAQRGA